MALVLLDLDRVCLSKKPCASISEARSRFEACFVFRDHLDASLDAGQVPFQDRFRFFLRVVEMMMKQGFFGIFAGFLIFC